MFRMMTPIDAISYGLRAGMVFGQAQTLWATRMIEMQGFWLGFPALVSDLPKITASVVEAPPVVTELHVEALAAAPIAAIAPTARPRPARKPKAVAMPDPAPVAEVPQDFVSLAPPPAPKPLDAPAPVIEAAVAPPALPAPALPEPAEVAPPAADLAAAPAVDLPAPFPPTGPAADSITPAVVPAEHSAPPLTPVGLALKPIPRRNPPKTQLGE